MTVPEGPVGAPSRWLEQVGADPTPERLRAWWDEAVRGQGVVVEEGPDPDHRAVTFVWRRRSEAEQAFVVIDTVTDRHRSDVSTCVLEPVAQTDLLARTLVLPADLRATYGYYVADRLDVTVGAERAGWREVLARLQPSPLNLDRVGNPHGGTGCVLALPEALAQPWTAPDPRTVSGRLIAGEVESRHFGACLSTWVYLPHRSHGAATAVAVLLDGDVWSQEIPIVPALDNLHAAGLIPPTTVVLTASGPGEARAQELALNPALPRYLREELLPWAATHGSVTEDPAASVVCGQSLGGLAAAYVPLADPARFGAGLVQSGSFWWPEDDPEVESGWLTRAYADLAPAEAARIRLFHEVGAQEWQLLEDNRAFHRAAVGAGVQVDYREFGGGHDYACWRGGIADGLISLLGRSA